MRFASSFPKVFVQKFGGFTPWLVIGVMGILLGSAVVGVGAERTKAKPALTEKEVRWMDIRDFGVEGRAWTETKAFYDRLPSKAEGKVRDAVWNLSRQSAGMMVRFVTDATNIQARWAVTSSNLAMPHMAATGVSGLDLYVRTAPDQWHWVGLGIPRAQTNTAVLASGLASGKREYALYLPLYNGTKFVELGVEAGAMIEKAGAWGAGERKPIVFYGTSILQGACASRPGMPHPAILGRKFNWPTVNLGFSGNGHMELEMADLLAELDPAVYVLDAVPNMTSEMVKERAENFVRRLRAAHPKTPIVMVEDRTYGNSFLMPEKWKKQEEQRSELTTAYQRLKKSGVKDLYYVKGEQLFGNDGEGAVDGSHPSDLGFMRQAEVLAKALKPLLKAK